MDSTGSLCRLENFSALITLWPTRPGSGEQTQISHQDSTSGWSLFLDDEGCLAAELGKAGDTQKFRLEGSLRERKWYQAWLTYDAQTSKLTLGKAILDPGLKSEDQTGSSSDYAFESVSQEIAFLIGAQFSGPIDSHFNGKLEAPTIFSRSLDQQEIEQAFSGKIQDGLLARWDFSREIPTSRMILSLIHI